MENRDIITAGRDDACGKASPSVVTKGRLPAALDGGLAFTFSSCQHKRGNHNDHGDNLEVRHDLTSSTFVFRGEKPSAICFLPAGNPKIPLGL